MRLEQTVNLSCASLWSTLIMNENAVFSHVSLCMILKINQTRAFLVYLNSLFFDDSTAF